LSDRSSAENLSKTPTLRRISAVDHQEAYWHAYQAIGLVSRPSWAQRLEHIKEESDSTTDLYEDRDAQQRVSYFSDVDDKFIVDNSHLLKHRDSLTLYEEGNNGHFFARRRRSFFESYQDSRLNNALVAYRMARRPLSGLTQIETSSDFNVDHDSVVPIVARAISDPSPVRDDTNDKFPPPPEEHLQSTRVRPRTPRRHRHHHRRRNLPGTHCTVPFNPREFENTVLAPPARQDQNQAFFAVIGAVIIIVFGAVVSNNNNIVIIVFYLLLLFFSFLAVFTDSFSKNILFWQNS
jgi:hypothetical protein